MTIQLPLYNEMYVVERLLRSMTQIDYPRDRFEIQVLDDSTDETQELARNLTKEIRKAGFQMIYLHRASRKGFKAGALREGMKTAQGELIAIFDADFVPPPDILKQMVHYFTDPRVGMVQARWGHLNEDFSLLTRIQSIFLDGHFVVQHTARNRSGRFFNFNGTAGIWRRSCIEDAGGWQDDTLTEDLDLSYRAQLRGWQFVYLPHVVAKAELPVEMEAFKSQQYRWAKGALQTARKLLPAIWKSQVALKVKCEASLHLLNNVAYVCTMGIAVLLLPVLLVRIQLGSLAVLFIDLPLFLVATASFWVFYLVAQYDISHSWWHTLRYIPMMTSLGVGLSVNNAKAAVEGLFSKRGDFQRTPKYRVEGKGAIWKDKRYAASRDILPMVELAFAVYYAVLIGYAVVHRMYVSIPFFLFFLNGFLYVSLLSWIQRLQRTFKLQLAFSR